MSDRVQAQVAMTEARRRIAILKQPKKLSEQERREASESIQSGGACRCCAGLHAGDELACPRLATFELDGDGHLKAGSYWPPGKWETTKTVVETDRVLFATDIEEDDERVSSA